MIEIDGSMYSGSGTLLRYAACLATVKGEPLHITRIRAKRPKPGLRAQHLSAVTACARVSGGRLEGAEVGSQELAYWPGPTLHGGRYRFDIGTAGSATMAAFTLIVPALFATGPSSFAITGGLFQDFAPSFFHMKEVLAPLLRKMGADVVLRMVKPGYVPEGRGELTMDVNPVDCLKPMRSTAQGTITKIHGIAISSHLKEQRVSHRMASRCKEALRRKGYSAEIDIMEDASAVQKGAALAIWAETDTGCILGADRAGRPGRSSESIADFVARSFVGDIESNACTDRHLADQLILFAAVAKGTTQFTVPAISEHVEANLWLVEKILGVQARVDANVITIEGAGLSRRQPDALG